MRLQLIYLALLAVLALAMPTAAQATEACIMVEVQFEYKEHDIRERVRFWRQLYAYTGDSIEIYVTRMGKPFPVDEKKVKTKCTDKKVIAILRVTAPDEDYPYAAPSNYIYGELVWQNQKPFKGDPGYDLWFSFTKPPLCRLPPANSTPEYVAFLNTIALYLHNKQRGGPASPAIANIIRELRRMKSIACRDFVGSDAYVHMDRVLKYIKTGDRR
jgi:hypothetical protein